MYLCSFAAAGIAAPLVVLARYRDIAVNGHTEDSR